MKPLLFALLIATANAADLPDPVRTPGVINPDVTQENIQETICAKGWTKTIRPPSSYTGKLKLVQIGEYGYADTDPSHYEEDHLISLELGGHPTDPRNLWPQPHETPSGRGSYRKDRLENTLRRLVCSGKIPLAEAQQAIAQDWIAAYEKWVEGK